MSRLRESGRKLWAALGPGAPPAKFVAYFQLLEACRGEGCPVCLRLEQVGLKALDSLLYEQTTDPATRRRLRASQGFCNWHAWMLPRVPTSALGVALIYRQLLLEGLEQVRATRQAARPGGFWRRLWERLGGSPSEPLPLLAWRSGKSRCPLCAAARRSERADLATLLEFIGEADFAEAFGGSAGLCLPHLAAAAAIGRDHPNLGRLLAAHEARWGGLAEDLEDFARTFDYRRAEQAVGREAGSWRRALEALAGRAGTFGPERGEGPEPPGPAAETPERPADG